MIKNKTVLKRVLIILLWLGAFFYITEFFLHALALPVLEHDKIFLVTHDRYIALFALTYATLLILISSNLSYYRTLFNITVIGVFLSFLNGLWISLQGGYAPLFDVVTLDRDLSTLGYLFLAWFMVLLIIRYFYYKTENN